MLNQTHRAASRTKPAIRYAIFLLLLVTGAPLAKADAPALPSWLTSDICARESAPGQCAAVEGFALKVVSSTWPFVVDAIKERCPAQLNSPADHSWRLLAGCIDAEALKARDRGAVNTAKTPAEPVPPPKSLAPPPETPKLQ